MSSTCFESDGSSTRKRLYIQMYTLLPTGLLITMHVKHTIPELYIQPSSWRWTHGFETCRRRKKN